MRVGVYLASLDPSYVGGVTTFALGLINGLAANEAAKQVIVLSSGKARPVLEPRIGTSGKISFQELDEPVVGLADRLTLLPGMSRWHERVRVRRMQPVVDALAASCDIAVFPLCFLASYNLPVPSIVSFHDLQHETFPRFFGWRNRQARRVLFGSTFRHASLMQASSLAMKQEALRFYGDRIAPERIAIIPEGVEFAVFSGPSDQDARSHYRLPDEFLFYPAQLWQHKNHLRLLHALDAIGASAGIRIPLVLTGAEYEAAPEIRRFIAAHGLADRIFLLGKVPFAHLLSLYKQACYVVSASMHESNCLPLLEAAASGTAIIAADIPANRETAAVFHLPLFDPLDVSSIADTVRTAWLNRHNTQAVVDANREVARRFDWSVVAGVYLDHAKALLAH